MLKNLADLRERFTGDKPPFGGSLSWEQDNTPNNPVTRLNKATREFAQKLGVPPAGFARIRLTARSAPLYELFGSNQEGTELDLAACSAVPIQKCEGPCPEATDPLVFYLLSTIYDELTTRPHTTLLNQTREYAIVTNSPQELTGIQIANAPIRYDPPLTEQELKSLPFTGVRYPPYPASLILRLIKNAENTLLHHLMLAPRSISLNQDFVTLPKGLAHYITLLYTLEKILRQDLPADTVQQLMPLWYLFKRSPKDALDSVQALSEKLTPIAHQIISTHQAIHLIPYATLAPEKPTTKPEMSLHKALQIINRRIMPTLYKVFRLPPRAVDFISLFPESKSNDAPAEAIVFLPPTSHETVPLTGAHFLANIAKRIPDCRGFCLQIYLMQVIRHELGHVLADDLRHRHNISPIRLTTKEMLTLPPNLTDPDVDIPAIPATGDDAGRLTDMQLPTTEAAPMLTWEVDAILLDTLTLLIMYQEKIIDLPPETVNSLKDTIRSFGTLARIRRAQYAYWFPKSDFHMIFPIYHAYQQNRPALTQAIRNIVPDLYKVAKHILKAMESSNWLTS